MRALNIYKEIKIMEVCGTHTMAILRSGIKETLPSNIKLISGPGCPVCVTTQGYIDASIKLSKREDLIITTFGDMINVPGTGSSLNIQRALGRDIRVVYSPLEAVNIAKKSPNKEIVFLGIGFETTAPLIALAIEKSQREGVENFSVFASLKTMPNIIRTLLKGDDVHVDGIICPGHVSTIIGAKAFEFISDEFKIPSVIAGFGSKDVMAAIYILTDMIKNNDAGLKNLYTSCVKYDGNKKAQTLMDKIFERSVAPWRGMGVIENSGLKIREKYKNYDAERKFGIEINEIDSSKECICGQILKGQKNPKDCIFFGNQCTPHSPIGVCMVSREGSCKVHYQYLRG